MKRAQIPLENVLAAVADRTRLRLLNLMHGGEVCVCFFVSILDELQPKVSRHLATLRQAGLVEARRDGKWIHYRISEDLEPATHRVMSALFASFEEDPAMQRDRSALARACCSPRAPEQLRRAPRPQIAQQPDA